MTTKVDMIGDTVQVHGIAPKQMLTDIGAAPTAAQLTAAFGSPASLARGSIFTLDDNAANTVSMICWTSGNAWFHASGTKAV